MPLIVPPQRPEDKGRAVLLKRHFREAVDDPGMPRRAPGTVRAVFVHQGGAVRRQTSAAEEKEAARDVLIAQIVQRGGNQRAITRPHIGVVGAGRRHDVAVVGGENGAAVIYLRAHDEQTAAEQVGDRARAGDSGAPGRERGVTTLPRSGP